MMLVILYLVIVLRKYQSKYSELNSKIFYKAGNVSGSLTKNGDFFYNIIAPLIITNSHFLIFGGGEGWG